MFILTNRYVLHLLAMAAFLHLCQAKSLVEESQRDEATDNTLWQPAEGTREEWMACRGMPKDVCERTKIKKQELKKILAMKVGVNLTGNDSSTKDSGVDQCIMFTEEQLDMMIAEAKNEGGATSANRKKRSLIDLKKYPTSKWSMPVSYMFDGAHDNNQKATIRAAFQHWANNTCVRFEELPTNTPFKSNFIIIQKIETDGCWSRLGRIEQIPQQMNLASDCVAAFAIVLHEIGHSLGLVHEQSRFGRNESIRILWDNIQMDAKAQYIEQHTDALGLPYNYGSIMHYPSKNGFAVSSEVDTMVALEPLYQNNMGQRSDLSFHDRKIINLAYCNASCKTPLTQPCQRSGYQNPNKCSTCICPDGFSGQYCSEIAPPQNANCGGILNIASGTEEVIKSPGYGAKGYSDYQQCTWWIKAPENYKLQLEFNGPFGVSSPGSRCFHWVEIKYKKDLGLEGARFCSGNRPSDIVISESNEMMVIFRSNYNLDPQWRISPLGFQATVKTTSARRF